MQPERIAPAVPHADTPWPWKIPLRRRDGTICAYALVDEADYATLMERRWCLNAQGYAQRAGLYEGRKVHIRMHRLLLGLVHYDGLEGDHRNLDRLDNRRSNLRVVTRGQQMHNLPSYAGSTSSYRGVSWHKAARKWQSKVRIDGRQHYLGLFEREEDAAAAAAAFRRQHMSHALS